MTSLAGTRIDNFRIVEKLGDGGMGEVYRAVDEMLERDVALKFLRPELVSQPELAERFRIEAVALARLHHPNIAAVHGLHRHGETQFMVMEYVPGQTLEHVIARDGRLPAIRALTIAIRLLDALEYAHKRGVIHRDVKSSNIIIALDGGVKVMDFGIARVLGGDRLTRVGLVVGTLSYMSPEQIQGLDVDARTDIYSAGIVLYEMLAGNRPFQADTEWALMQAQISQPPPPFEGGLAVPPEVEAAMKRALSKDRTVRYQSANEFRDDLERERRQLAQSALSPGGIPSDVDGDYAGALPGGSEPTVTAMRSWPSAPHDPDLTVLGQQTPAELRRLATPPPVPPSRTPAPAVHPPASAAERTPPMPFPAAVADTPMATPKGAPGAPMATAKAATKAPPAKGAVTGLSPTHLMAAGIAVAVIALAAAGFWWMRQASVEPVPTPTKTVAPPAADAPLQAAATPPETPPPAATPADTVAAASTPPAVAPGTPGQPPAGAVTGAPGAPGAKPPATADARRRNREPVAAPPPVAAAAPEPVAPPPPPVTTSEPTPPPPPAAPAPTPVAPIARFGGVKVVANDGGRTRERDVILQFEGDELVVVATDGRTRIRSLRYGSIGKIEYERQGGRALFVPTTRHLLTLDVGGEAVVLRLDSNNRDKVLATLSERTGKKIESLADAPR